MTEFRHSTPLGYGHDGNVVAIVSLDDRPANRRGTKQVRVHVSIDERTPLLDADCYDITTAFALFGSAPANGGYWSRISASRGPVATAALEALESAWRSPWVSATKQR